jgi:hypothetical protein
MYEELTSHPISSIPLSGDETNRLHMSPRLIAEWLKGPQLDIFHLGLLKFDHLTPRFRESITTTIILWVAMEDFVMLNGKVLRHSRRKSTLPWCQFLNRFRFDVRVSAPDGKLDERKRS